ncbi:MAG: hypothetical protein HYW57_05745 [Ignavibacteriales bacterium]|nr:hypothetical protein [Ignavibacteriales bacterium]
MNDHHSRRGKTLFLNIIWHQHQPLYLDPGTDQLQGPWVRTHGTKDYYDMAAVIARYPDIHCTVNLTSSLLYQLDEYYVKRLKPFVNLTTTSINADKFLAKQAGKTDPWIDLALKPTSDFDVTDLEYLLSNTWNAFGMSEVMFERFPQYKSLRDKYRNSGVNALSEQERREVKFWFYLASFDPDFLAGKEKLVTGVTVNVSEFIEKNHDGTYTLKRPVSEEDCQRMVVEAYKVLSAIIPIHKKMMYDPSTYKGQIEIITTPFYHPILPLIYDSDLAKLCQPGDPMPQRFHFPRDAEMQVAKAVHFYKRIFGVFPQGMWPAEGSVAHDIIPVFARHGIRWIATDEKILSRSKPPNRPKFFPYAAHSSSGSTGGESLAILFRDTELSDKIGFAYQNWSGEDAAEDFIQSVLRYAPQGSEPDRLLTVILDGENAWEWYKLDHDGKQFQNALYRKLSKLSETKEVMTVTVSEYLKGNPLRGVPAHPIDSLPRIEWLWPGSWINANFDTWIGEDEENRAWEYLLTARSDLGESGVKEHAPDAAPSRKGTKQWYGYKAWESLYAAEGSDWFWWYGTDQSAPAGEKPFDLAYITHLNNIYEFARKAGGRMPERKFEPIIRDEANLARAQRATMAQSSEDLVTVMLQCDANGIYVRKTLFVVGNHDQLGNWVPNKMKMYDDGTHGDRQAGDNIWTLEMLLPAGSILEYKYTNSGAVGSWEPGEEFPGVSRRVVLDAKPGATMILLDRFGIL